MKNEKINIGIVGCGNIAEKYLDQISSYDNIKLIGLSDIEIDRAQNFSSIYKCQFYESLDKMLLDENIDLIVNLTIHHAHAEVIEKILTSGKHVYTEKPLAMNYKDAKRIIDISEKRNLRLSSAPITYMGEMQQTAYKKINDGLPVSYTHLTLPTICSV